MTVSPARSPRLLLTIAVVLAVVGVFLLTMPGGSRPAAPPAPLPSADRAAQAKESTHASPSTASMQQGASALPPHGEGAAGDAAIQQSLEDAWPADLAPADARQLLTAGRGLLRADATGVGRATWPTVFGDPDQVFAPAFAMARFRIQAAVARRAGNPDIAVVHLVWAGADRGGTFTDRRVTNWYFTRTSTKGASAWMPKTRL
ncbi:hypothetical protein [Streptomyces sp. NPDC127084]|uniref:hypothetical protein n=1 Tax=Streptomyces sp. NPDC127084 TaxID=3347133 RepID=UPI003664F1F3